MAFTLNSAAQEIVSYWETSKEIPFKGQLISRDNDGNVCMCAQGQVLHILGGYTEEQLFDMAFWKADGETARILGISVSHSVFLRRINDNCEGSPQEVLSNPKKYLGPNFEQVLDFWKYIDGLNEQEKEEIADRCRTLDYDVRKSADDAAWNAADEVVGREFRTAAWSAPDAVSELVVFGDITMELIGDVENKVFYDLIMSYKES